LSLRKHSVIEDSCHTRTNFSKIVMFRRMHMHVLLKNLNGQGSEPGGWFDFFNLCDDNNWCTTIIITPLFMIHQIRIYHNVYLSDILGNPSIARRMALELPPENAFRRSEMKQCANACTCTVIVNNFKKILFSNTMLILRFEYLFFLKVINFLPINK